MYRKNLNSNQKVYVCWTFHPFPYTRIGSKKKNSRGCHITQLKELQSEHHCWSTGHRPMQLPTTNNEIHFIIRKYAYLATSLPILRAVVRFRRDEFPQPRMMPKINVKNFSKTYSQTMWHISSSKTTSCSSCRWKPFDENSVV